MKKYYLEGQSSDDLGGTGMTPRRRSEAEKLMQNFDSDDDEYELETMHTKEYDDT